MAGNGDSEGPVGVEKGSMPFGFYVFDQAAMEQVGRAHLLEHADSFTHSRSPSLPLPLFFRLALL